jgi:ABC-2 type transport system permease protein
VIHIFENWTWERSQLINPQILNLKPKIYFMTKINWHGALTLLKKEVWRFLKVYHQTLFSPVINIILFLAVFSLSVGHQIKEIEGVEFAVFMSAGLIAMAAMQNAFANSSSSFVMGKVMGHIVDYLIPPLGAFELLFAFALGAVLRGICVAIVSFIAISFFVSLPIFSFWHLLFYLTFSCLFLGLLGILCGVVSETFDHMSAMTSYLITPLTFLSGTFYSTNSLPEFWRNVSHFNPFFYMIDGVRYAISGHSDAALGAGAAYILCLNLILGIVLFLMIKRGYRIKN